MRISEKEALDVCKLRLSKLGYRPFFSKDDFVYAGGSIPILLVAHVDTVHFSQPSEICYDPTNGVAWSKHGIGGDDRAGVWSIFEVLKAGYRPHVLFTTGEEKGGVGAKVAAKHEAPKVKCMIELDRMNDNDAVFYSCDNKAYTQWVESFGWKEASGTFTDISVLMPAWGVAGVNLSVGYYQQHSQAEHIRIGETLRTIELVKRMLQAPPAEVMKYETKKYEYAGNSGYLGGGTYYRGNYMDDTEWRLRDTKDFPTWRQRYKESGPDSWEKIENLEQLEAFRKKYREAQVADRATSASASSASASKGVTRWCHCCDRWTDDFLSHQDAECRWCVFKKGGKNGKKSGKKKEASQAIIRVRVPVKDRLTQGQTLVQPADYIYSCLSCSRDCECGDGAVYDSTFCVSCRRSCKCYLLRGGER